MNDARQVTRQAASGAFPSVVQLPDGSTQCDENGFVTALMLFEPVVSDVVSRGLDFLERCESTRSPGHFSFYPEDAVPNWMPVGLPPDADDTALIAMLLVRFGRRPPGFLDWIADSVLEPHRLRYRAEWCPPWFREGAYFTWLRAGYPRNVIDCCVNVNVLALRSLTTNRTGIAETLAMLTAAVDWAGESEARARMLSPWYPHPVELAHAVRRAIQFGNLPELDPLRQKIERYPWAKVATQATPVCGSADGRFLWTCEALQTIRGY